IMSLSAAATLSMAAPALAGTQHRLTGHTGAKQAAGVKPAAAKSRQHANGVGEPLREAGFGVGKPTSLIEPMPGTFPPSLAGTTFPDLDLVVDYPNDGSSMPCQQNVAPKNDVEHCTLQAIVPNGPYGIPDGVTYSVHTQGSSVVPTGWLLPAAATKTMNL